MKILLKLQIGCMNLEILFLHIQILFVEPNCLVNFQMTRILSFKSLVTTQVKHLMGIAEFLMLILMHLKHGILQRVITIL